MVKTWKSEIVENEACPSCGAEYQVKETRFPAREIDKFNCVKCGDVVKSWRGTSSYAYTLIESEEKKD